MTWVAIEGKTVDDRSDDPKLRRTRVITGTGTATVLYIGPNPSPIAGRRLRTPLTS